MEINITVDKRECERNNYDGSFKYELSIPDYLEPRLVEAEGIGIDRSAHGRGIGFCTDFPLEPGHVLRLMKSEGVYFPAVVKWVEKTEENYRVGIYLFR